MSDVAMPLPQDTGDDYFDLSAVQAALAKGDAITFPPFEVLHIPQMGLNLCLNMARDPIQNAWRRGEFFEEEELGTLSDNIKDGAHIIDIGANVGNHALYFATRMNAARVVVAEPNPLALAPLVANVVINDLTDVIDLGALGVGLSDQSQGGFGMKRHDKNLGATKMFEGRGALEVHRGDDLFADEAPDLIKIDVEGMEMKVLSGLEETISKHRPMILIEVDGENDADFAAWFASHEYDVINEIRHSRKNCNYILRPEAYL